MTDNIVLWYAGRASGVVALLLLTASVVLGIVGSLRVASPRWPRFAVAALHRNIALLTFAFVAVHVASSVVDTYAGIGWLDTVLPYGSAYEPLWLGVGAAANDLFLALVVTSLLRRHVSLGLWRAVHWMSYACWPLALLHSLNIGTDTDSGWLRVLALTCAGEVLVAVVARVAWSRRTAPTGTHRAAGARW